MKKNKDKWKGKENPEKNKDLMREEICVTFSSN